MLDGKLQTRWSYTIRTQAKHKYSRFLRLGQKHYLTLVHVFLCIPQLAAQLAYPLIHEFYHMKIIHYKRVFDGSTDNTSFYLIF